MDAISDPSKTIQPMDFSKISPEFKKEIVREGTVHLDGQLRIAAAADARASVLAGIFTAAATALTAGVVVSIFNAAGNALTARIPLIVGGGVAAAFFITAAILSIRAIFPVAFWLPGLAPQNWASDVRAGRSLDECLAERAQHIQEQVDENLATINQNARYFAYAAVLGIAAPFLGFVAWLLAIVWLR